MIESNENLCEYEFFLVRNLKTGTNWFNQGHQDSIPKTRNVPAKPRQLECLSLMDTAGKKKMQVKRQLTDPKVMTLGYGWHLSDRAELSYLYIYIYIYICLTWLIDRIVESGTSWTSPDEHLPKQYLWKRLSNISK